MADNWGGRVNPTEQETCAHNFWYHSYLHSKPLI